jgi:hypothetical protein
MKKNCDQRCAGSVDAMFELVFEGTTESGDELQPCRSEGDSSVCRHLKLKLSRKSRFGEPYLDRKIARGWEQCLGRI